MHRKRVKSELWKGGWLKILHWYVKYCCDQGTCKAPSSRSHIPFFVLRCFMGCYYIPFLLRGVSWRLGGTFSTSCSK